MKKTKISIIGCGAVADLMYMPAINQLKNIQIANLVDLNDQFTSMLAEKNNLSKDICSKVLPTATEDNEIALVLVPTGLHEKVGIECLKKLLIL